MKTILFFSVLSLLFYQSVFAVIIHVPAQYPTIQQGIDAASAGDIVMVAPGRYMEEILLKADVVVLGAGEGLSIIDGGGNAGDVVKAIGNNINNNTKFKGFTVTGAISGGSMPGGGGIFCNSGADPEIANNRLEGNDQGIAVWNQSCAFIHNNVIINNNYSGISLSANAPVINNTIAGNRYGIYDGGGYGPTVMNNIVTGNWTYGIRAVGTQPVLTYNDVWGNTTNYSNCSPGIGSISTNPMYQDTLNGNYHLQPTSPCIDTGNPLPEYNDPDGSKNDMGAYGGPGAVINLPRVTLTTPSQNELNVACTTNVSAVFNLAMNSLSFTPLTFRVSSNCSGLYSGTIIYDSSARMATINPNTDFRCGELVTATLTRGVRSINGDSIKGFTWQFITKLESGSGHYGTPSFYSAGYAPNCVVTGEFNFNHNLDLAVTNALSNRVSILLGNGNGNFNLVTNYLIGTEPCAIISANFNSDSMLDLAVVNKGSNNISILLGNGDGTFQTAVNYTCGNLPLAICSGDFNLDGNLDLAVANGNSNNVSVFFGNGNGSFNLPVNYSVGNQPSSICIGDFDNDGIVDLITSNENSNNISLLLGNNDGTFNAAINFSVGTNPMSLCPGDFNEDGNLDLAIANSGSNNLSVLLGNGNGGFGTAINYPTGNSPRSTVTSDLDGDGSLDLVVANRVSNNISIFIGNGNGSFGTAVNYPAGNNPYSVCLGDFDNDEDIDLSVANYTADSISVLLNEDALEIVSTNPLQNQLDVLKSANVSASFNIDINSNSLCDSSFILYGAKSGPHTGTLNYDSVTHTATFDPSLNFFDGELITTLLTREIQTLRGVNLQGFSWDFTAEISTSSNGTFNNRQDFPTGMEPRGMCAGDFDADGDIDLAVTSSNWPNPGQISVLLNNGNGTFTAPSYYTVVQDPISVYGADLDSDNDIDLAVVHNEPNPSHLVILKNNGNGTFSQFASYTPLILGQAVSGGDLDLDGDIDLVMTDGWGSGNNVKVMLNNGNGSFSGPYTYSAGAAANGVIVKDIDNDGDMDIVVANSSNDNISVLLNRGDGTFPHLANYTVGDNPTSLYGNDFNGDGYIDIATANYSGDNITVIINNGDGTFSSPSGYSTGSYTRFINGGDFDGDGDIDLTVTTNGADSIVVLLNNGNGTFASAIAYNVGESPWGIETADFNRDGALDIGCANFDTDNVTIWYNTGAAILEGNPTPNTVTFLRIHQNPFREKVEISYRIANQRNKSIQIKLKIYDATGGLVKDFNHITNNRSAYSSFVWDGRDNLGRKVPPGVYFICFEAEDYTKSEKMILLR